MINYKKRRSSIVRNTEVNIFILKREFREKKGGGGGFRTEFDKIACDNLIQNYAFKSDFTKVYFKSIVLTPFLTELKNPLKFFKNSKMRKVYGLIKDNRVAPFESGSGLLEKKTKR